LIEMETMQNRESSGGSITTIAATILYCLLALLLNTVVAPCARRGCPEQEDAVVASVRSVEEEMDSAEIVDISMHKGGMVMSWEETIGGEGG